MPVPILSASGEDMKKSDTLITLLPFHASLGGSTRAASRTSDSVDRVETVRR